MKSALACAIYTRKSSEEGLEQNFNSLDAQREACTAYIQSQKQEGWRLLPDTYDDGGYSGGTLERPALQRLLEDIAASKVQIVVVYKVDRLTRSLADFAKIVERFDAQGVSFVSVTQQFNTTSSMGRLTLNVLLSFAQFEREVTGERIRDKIAASKKKGLWMGGIPPMGYLAKERTLAIDERQAERVQEIFRLYLALGGVRQLQSELDQRGWRTPARSSRRSNASGNRPFSRGHLYRMLSNPIYRGLIIHKGTQFPGQHPAIIDQALWDLVQDTLATNCQGRKGRLNARQPSLLSGLIFDGEGAPLTPTHACKGNRRYRYYVSQNLLGKLKDDVLNGLRIPALALEEAVRNGLAGFLSNSHQLMAAFPALEISAGKQLMLEARTWANVMDQGTAPAQIAFFNQLIQRITVTQERLELYLNPQSFAAVVGQSVAESPIRLRLPVRFRRSGLGIRMVIEAPGNLRKQAVDPRLVKLVDRGIGWFQRMVGKPPQSVGKIAAADGVSTSFVTRVMYLSFLAPDIVMAIRSGCQPMTLTADSLLRTVPLPMAWAEQRRVLGFTP